MSANPSTPTTPAPATPTSKGGKAAAAVATVAKKTEIEDVIVDWLKSTFHFLTKSDENAWAALLVNSGMDGTDELAIIDKVKEYFSQEQLHWDSFRRRLIELEKPTQDKVFEKFLSLHDDLPQLITELGTLLAGLDRIQFRHRLWEKMKRNIPGVILSIVLALLCGLAFLKLLWRALVF